MSYNPWYLYQQMKLSGESYEQIKQALYSKAGTFDTGSHIDPRRWFGGLVETYKEIPKDLADILADKIIEDGAKEIYTFGRLECQIPTDWHKYLVQKLIDHGIRVGDDCTTTLEGPLLSGCGREPDGTFTSKRKLGIVTKTLYQEQEPVETFKDENELLEGIQEFIRKNLRNLIKRGTHWTIKLALLSEFQEPIEMDIHGNIWINHRYEQFFKLINIPLNEWLKEHKFIVTYLHANATLFQAPL